MSDIDFVLVVLNIVWIFCAGIESANAHDARTALYDLTGELIERGMGKWTTLFNGRKKFKLAAGTTKGGVT